VFNSFSTGEPADGLENEFPNEEDIEIIAMTTTMPIIKISK